VSLQRFRFSALSSFITASRYAKAIHVPSRYPIPNTGTFTRNSLRNRAFLPQCFSNSGVRNERAQAGQSELIARGTNLFLRVRGYIRAFNSICGVQHWSYVQFPDIEKDRGGRWPPAVVHHHIDGVSYRFDGISKELVRKWSGRCRTDLRLVPA